MTRQDAVVIASRTVALLQLIPALFDLIRLPYETYFAYRFSAVVHQEFGRPVTGMTHSVWDGVFASLLSIAVRLLIGAFFWRRGPMVEKLFARSANDAQ